MALTILTSSFQAGAINYTYRTDGSADWTAVPTASYFYDTIDRLVRFKARNGDIQSPYAFPFSGSAVITGSLNIVSGSVQSVYTSPQRATSTSITASQFDSTITFGNATPTTCSLYTAVGTTGNQLILKNTGSAAVRVVASGSQTIDGQTNRTLATFESLILQSNGSNWNVINNNPGTIQFAHEWNTTNPVSSNTTYFIGNFMGQDPSQIASNSRRVVAPFSGWITDVSLMVSVAGTIATNETSTMTLRNVTTTATTVITSGLQHNTASQLLQFNLSPALQVTRGDVLEIQWVTGNWLPANRPGAVRQIFQALVQ